MLTLRERQQAELEALLNTVTMETDMVAIREVVRAMAKRHAAEYKEAVRKGEVDPRLKLLFFGPPVPEKFNNDEGNRP